MKPWAQAANKLNRLNMLELLVGTVGGAADCEIAVVDRCVIRFVIIIQRQQVSVARRLFIAVGVQPFSNCFPSAMVRKGR